MIINTKVSVIDRLPASDK